MGAPEPQDWASSHVGVDRGIVVPLALSDGSTYEHGSWLTEEEEARLLRTERQAAHRKQYRKRGERVSKRLRVAYDQIKGLLPDLSGPCCPMTQQCPPYFRLWSSA